GDHAEHLRQGEPAAAHAGQHEGADHNQPQAGHAQRAADGLQLGAIGGAPGLGAQIRTGHAGSFAGALGMAVSGLPAEPSYSDGSVRVSGPPSGSELRRPMYDPGLGDLPAAKSSMIWPSVSGVRSS